MIRQLRVALRTGIVTEPAGTLAVPTSVSRAAYRRTICTGVAQRKISSTAAGTDEWSRISRSRRFDSLGFSLQP